MVGVLTSNDVDGGFEPRSGQTKEYTIGIYCLLAKNAALNSKAGWLRITSERHVYPRTVVSVS